MDLTKVYSCYDTGMSIHKWKKAAPDLICIGIDICIKTEYAGRIWHQYADSPVYYKSTMDIVWIMNRLFDEWDFPQNFVKFWSFTEAEISKRRPRKRRSDLQMDVNRIQGKIGDKGTFVVHVKYRQNATWQGDVIWVEKKRRQSFRSAMELFHLIDSAFESGSDKEEGGLEEEKL